MTRTITFRRFRGAFTLAEILVALGVLAVGASLVAAVFPPAIQIHARAVRDRTGDAVCRNALATVRRLLKASDVSQASLAVLADEAHTSLLAIDQQHDPQGGDGRRGFVVLGRRVAATGDEQIVVVAYRKLSGGAVTAYPTPCSVPAGSVEITGAVGLRVGSPLIDAEGKGYARIVSVRASGTEGTLDHPISATGAVTSAFVVAESGQERLSPALATRMTMTALRR